MFLVIEHSRRWSVILKFLWENIFKQETLQNPRFGVSSEIIVGAHNQTGITSTPTFLFMEHSKSWSVILQFLWENIFKQEALQNPRYYPWSILKVGQ